MSYFLLAVTILLKSVGNSLGKQAGLATAGSGIQSLLFSPYYLGMLLAYAVQAGIWVITLRRWRLTVAYPFLSLSFLMDIASARIIFGETVSQWQLVGLGVIFVGVLVMMTGDQIVQSNA